MDNLIHRMVLRRGKAGGAVKLWIAGRLRAPFVWGRGKCKKKRRIRTRGCCVCDLRVKVSG